MDFTFKSQRERIGQWWAKRTLNTQEDVDPVGVTVPAWLVRATKFASWLATCSLIYFLWLYTLDIARDRAGELHITHAGAWTGEFSFWWPYVIGFAIVAFGIPYVAKIAIPTFMSLGWRGNFWPKLWALIIAFSVSLVVIAGTFAVQGDTLMERDRESAVAVEQVQQGRAVLEARISARQQELSEMMNNRNAYLAQAASVGAAEWERSYVAQARATNDPQLPRIERALGAARAADTVRADLQSLREQLAQAPAVAAVQGEVVTERTGWIADTLGWLEGIRAILLSLVMDIVALMMPWIALRLEQARSRQLGFVTGVVGKPWAPEELRIEDMRQQTPPPAAPMDAAYKGDAIFDERGNELRWVEGFVRKKDGKWIPGHYRPTGKKQKATVDVTFTDTEGNVRTFSSGGAASHGALVGDDGSVTEIERGVVQDGGGRIALGRDGNEGVMQEASEGDPDNVEAPTQTTPTDEELEALDAAIDAANAEQQNHSGDEPDQEGGHLDPAKVAAE